MATTIEELAVRFSAQTEDLTRELRRLESTAARSGKKTAKKLGGIQKSLNKIGAAAKSAGGLLAGAFAARAVVSGINDLFTSMNDLQTAAEGLGTTVENIQELRFAFTKVGADATKVEQVIRDFTKRIGEAKQNLGTLFPFLKKFNIELNNIDGTGKNVDQLMDEVADKIANMGSATDRAALANAAFGRVWVDVVAVMGKGSESLSELRKQARQTGAVMSGELVKSAAEADAQFNILTLTLGTALKGAFLELLQDMNLLNKSPLQKVTGEITRFSGIIDELSEKFKTLEKGGFKALLIASPLTGGIEGEMQRVLAQLDQARAELNKLVLLKENFAKIEDSEKKKKADDKTKAEADKAATALAKVRAKVAADLDALALEVFKINNNIFAIIDETARRELETFKKTFEGKVGFEQDFLKAKKLIEEKRIAATIEAQQKIDEELKKGKDKAAADRIAKDKETATEAQKILEENMREAQRHADDFANSFQTAFDDLIFAGGKLGDVLKSLLKDLARMVLHKAILGPLASSIGSGLSSAFGFASGGVMTGSGPAPLRKYAGGGVATSPQLAMFGEGTRPEAYVPLPDGRNIPVKIEGGGAGGPTQVIQHFTFLTDVKNTVKAEIMQALPLFLAAAKGQNQATRMGIR